MSTMNVKEDQQPQNEQIVSFDEINRIKRAVGTRLTDPNMSVVNALKEGGFTSEELGLLGSNDNDNRNLDNDIDGNDNATNNTNVKLKELKDKFNAMLRQVLVVIDHVEIDNNNNDSKPQQQMAKSNQSEEEAARDSITNGDNKVKVDCNDAGESDSPKHDNMEESQHASSSNAFKVEEEQREWEEEDVEKYINKLERHKNQHGTFANIFESNENNDDLDFHVWLEDCIGLLQSGHKTSLPEELTIKLVLDLGMLDEEMNYNDDEFNLKLKDVIAFRNKHERHPTDIKNSSSTSSSEEEDSIKSSNVKERNLYKWLQDQKSYYSMIKSSNKPNLFARRKKLQLFGIDLSESKLVNKRKNHFCPSDNSIAEDHALAQKINANEPESPSKKKKLNNSTTTAALINLAEDSDDDDSSVEIIFEKPAANVAEARKRPRANNYLLLNPCEQNIERETTKKSHAKTNDVKEESSDSEHDSSAEITKTHASVNKPILVSGRKLNVREKSQAKVEEEASSSDGIHHVTEEDNHFRKKMREFKRRHRHVQVEKQSNPDLHRWLDLQKKRILSPNNKDIQPLSKEDRILLVLEIGILDQEGDDTWNNSLQSLIAFRDKYGRNPRYHADEKKLYNWFRSHKNSKNKKLKNSVIRAKKLSLFISNTSLGPVVMDNELEDHLKKLRHFKKKFGHCRIDEDDEFYDWFASLKDRILHPHENMLRPVLAQEHITELVLDVGILDGEKIDDDWNARLKELIEYYRKHNRCPHRHGAEKSLCYWLEKQRGGPVNENRKAKLDVFHFDRSTGMILSSKKQNGENMCIGKNKQELFNACQLSSVETHDQANEMPEQETHQREKLTKNETLKSAACKNAYPSLQKVAAWQSRFEELKEYQRKHGHSNVPRAHTTLGKWVKYQRNLYCGDNLSEEKIDALNGVGFVWRFYRLVNSGEKGTRKKIRVSIATRKTQLDMPGLDFSQKLSQRRKSNVAVAKCSDDYDNQEISECYHNKSTEDDLADAHGKLIPRKKSKKKILKTIVKADYISIWMCSSCFKRFDKEKEALGCKCLGSGGSISAPEVTADYGSY